ncbi:DUF1648 domain-containing protein [Tsukamurella pseudospumae]|uniref:DUF1648 domain-containing protein n=1 Tax=Tsukamurella pseudospumae TaxID=239498 RepID=A0A138AK41_9ACTN|nr:DUF1648 domain-containing protein [Tsukamurella pseudospumae]KXP10824.1 hypothetical protein AXK60_05960 [Tsukamurella pseudospumae]
MRPRWWILVGSLILCAAALAWAASSGPDPFPTHWGLNGAGDSFSPRGRALAINAAGAAGVAVLFALLAKFVSAIPDAMINLPPGTRAYWLDAEHRAEFDALLQRWLLMIGSGVLLLLTITIAGAILGSGSNPVLAVAVWVFLALILAGVVHLIRTLVTAPKRAA